MVTAVARGRAHMTVLRREDVQSRVASWDGCPYRMLCPPILAIAPLIIRRLRGPSLTRVMISFHHLIITPSRGSVSCARRVVDRWHGCGLQRRPQEARQLARDRDRDLGRGLVLFHQASATAAQALLRLVRDRDDPARLAL